MEKGLILTFTGNGKGKTTAALGTALRCAGWGKKVCFFQFLKSPDLLSGEKNFFENSGLEFISSGIGFSWTKTPEEQRQSIKKAWNLALEKLNDCSYDLVVLDEILNVLCISNFEINDIINDDMVINALKNRPENMDVILTGRNASQKIIEISHTVTSMEEIKHAYKNGIMAKKGIEY